MGFVVEYLGVAAFVPSSFCYLIFCDLDFSFLLSLDKYHQTSS